MVKNSVDEPIEKLRSVTTKKKKNTTSPTVELFPEVENDNIHFTWHLI